MNSKLAAEEIFRAGIYRVLPDRLINGAMFVRDNFLFINEKEFNLDLFKHIYLVGAGKASALMAAEVERILGETITEGHIVVKYGHSCKLKHVKVTEAGHPVPDSNGFEATKSIVEICRRASENDLVICLLSGGGSALLTDCPEGLDPVEIINLSGLLVRCGATIGEINTVRKHLSKVKGGQLARAVYPGTIVSLILSDVIGDPLDVIASGPTVPDPTTFQQGLDIFKKYNLYGSIPRTIVSYFNEGAKGKKPETPKPGDKAFSRTCNILIGNNKLALDAAKEKALELKFNTLIADDRVEGDIDKVAEHILKTAMKFQHDTSILKPACILFGGEPTVKVTGGGSGGRNQHLALFFASLLRNQKGITLLSGGTDGSDGPTSSAGAMVDCNTFDNALSNGVDPAKYLREFDSFNFFKRTGGQIITGPTMTNVMDLIVIIVE